MNLQTNPDRLLVLLMCCKDQNEKVGDKKSYKLREIFILTNLVKVLNALKGPGVNISEQVNEGFDLTGDLFCETVMGDQLKLVLHKSVS